MAVDRCYRLDVFVGEDVAVKASTETFALYKPLK
jgi:hypothetical protein